MKVTANVKIDERKLSRQFESLATRYVNRLAREIAREARLAAPMRTGRLRKSIHSTRAVVNRGFHVSASVVADAKYARFVHEGTRPHMIRARRAKALHFFWARTGQEVFFKSVHHPGSRPNPFLTRAARIVAAKHR